MHASTPLKKYFRTTDPVTVLFARFFPVLRQLNGIVAGVSGMSLVAPSCCSMPSGAALWVGALGVYCREYFSANTAAAAQFANDLVFAAGAAYGLIVLAEPSLSFGGFAAMMDSKSVRL